MARAKPAVGDPEQPPEQPPGATLVASVLSDTWVDGVRYRAGALIEIDAAVGAAYVSGGAFDDNADAISQRLSEGVEIVRHVPPAAPEAAAQDSESL